METLAILGLCLLNLVIGWLNCRSVGSIWQESKALGGFIRVLAWCGAVQSVVAFSSVLILILAGGAHLAGLLPLKYANAAVSLWYLLVIIPALGTGLVITIHSWIVAWRERSILSYGEAAWNTFAMGSNIYNALSDVPDAFGAVSSLFSDSDDEGALIGLVLLVVAIALGGGVLLTFSLIRRYAAANPPQALS